MEKVYGWSSFQDYHADQTHFSLWKARLPYQKLLFIFIKESQFCLFREIPDDIIKLLCEYENPYKKPIWAHQFYQ